MPEGILELAGAVPVELIRDGLAFLGARIQRLLHEGIHILHISFSGLLASRFGRGHDLQQVAARILEVEAPAAPAAP